MAENTTSPFSGLDKALIRSTKSADSELEYTPRDGPVSGVSSEKTRRRTTSRVGQATERSNERTKVRHSFDIYRDQLLELSTIQSAIYRETGKKPTVGELVQEALDAFIARSQRRTK